MTGLRRRALLGAVGTAVGASLAGCWGSAIESEEQSDGGVLADARDWLPAPSAIDREGYGVEAVDLDGVADGASQLGESLREDLLPAPDVPRIDDVEDLSARFSVGRHALVLLGDHDVEAIETAHGEAGYERQEDYRDRPVFWRSVAEEPGGVAVTIAGDDGVVHVRRPSDVASATPRKIAKAIVDAADGEARRLAEASDHFSRTIEELPAGDVLTARAHPRGRTFRWGVGEGLSWFFDDPTTEVRGTVLFDTARIDELAVSEWADAAPVFHGETAETTADQPIVRVSASVPTNAITERPSAFPGPTYRPVIGPDAPGAAFSASELDTEENSGLLAVTYDAGDPIARERITVRGDGVQSVPGADQTSPGQWAGSANGSDGTVTSGDSVYVGVGQEYAVRLEFAQPDRSEPAILVRFEGDLDAGGPTVVVDG